MKNNKIFFSHFEDDNGITKQKIQIYAGNLNMDWIDDVELDMEIVNGEIIFNILNQHYYNKNEIKSIYNDLKKIDWNNGYEFFTFYDINDKNGYILIGDKNSSVANMVYSSNNMNNINNTIKKI